MSEQEKKRSGGGSATNAGIEYQAKVAAWAASHILSGSGASPYFDLPQSDKFTTLSLETQNSVDDLKVETALSADVFIQAKRGITLGKTATSELGKTIEQFVLQYRERKTSGRFASGKDKYVLLAGETSSQSVHKVAASVLDKLRSGADSTTFPKAEQDAHVVLVNHVKRAWQANESRAITDDELRELLSVVFIRKLDVMDDGADAQTAKNILRTSVLSDAKQEAAAWSILSDGALALARKKGKVEAATLEDLLHGKSIGLKSVVDFEKDITQLRQYTHQTMSSLSRSSSIKLPSKELKVKRSVVDELYNLATSGKSFIVVGEPGAGKSGALYETIERLQKDKCDIVAMATEKVGATSLGELRGELGLDHELVTVLTNWRGTGKGVLVIDALDAARDPQAADLFLDVVHQVLAIPSSRWSVIISIRKYDLRYNRKIKEVFPHDQISRWIDPEFQISHVNVPLFDETEMDQLKRASPELGELVNKAGGKMAQLLKSPFNLSIAAEIMSAGVKAGELTEVESQLELLDRYWEVRVTDEADKKGDARSLLLGAALNLMANRQSLKIGRQELGGAQPSLVDQITQLLSRNVLVEDKATKLLGFYHHILYDYGVYKTVLNSGPNKFTELLKTNPYLTLSVRPSIQMYWRNRWQQDELRAAFWTEVIKLESDKDIISNLAKTLGPEFAIGAIKSPDDMSALLDAMLSEDQRTSEGAQAVVRRCSNVMAAAIKRGEDDGAQHWVTLVKRGLEKFTDYPMRLKLCSILESAVSKWELLDAEQKKAAGFAARKLLEVELSQEPPNDWITRTSIKLISLTYATDPSTSSDLLGKLLEDERIARYGYIYLRHFADNAGELADKDSKLVELLYKKAFNYHEKSDETTSITNSQILGLNSNRKQDYGMVHHQLGWSFAKVIEKDLALALRVLHHVLASTLKERGRTWRLPTPRRKAQFEFEGVKVTLVEDSSYFWNPGLAHNDATDTLKSFWDYMKQLSELSDGPEKFKAALKAAAPTNESAIFWRIVLEVGEKYDDTLGSGLTPLLIAQPILGFEDTAHQASKFLEKVYPKLDKPTREEMEKAIVNLRDIANDEKEKKWLGSISDEFILLLDEDSIVIKPVQVLHATLKAEKGPRSLGKKPYTIESSPINDEEFDRLRGIKPNSQNKALEKLSHEAQEPLGRLTPSNLTSEDAAQVLRLIEKLKDALKENAKADLEWRDIIREKVISASQLLTCSSLFVPSSPQWPALRQDIIDGTGLQAPTFDQEHDDAFAKDGIIYGPAPRSTAAHAVMALASKEAEADSVDEIRKLVRALSRDKVAAVRASIAGEVHLLWYKKDPSFAWEIIDYFVGTETHPQVIEGLLHSVGGLRQVELERATQTIIELYKRFGTSGSEQLRQTAVVNLALMYVDRNEAAAREVLKGIIDGPAEHFEELERATVHLRERLVYGLERPSGTKARELRARATWFMGELLINTVSALEDWQARNGQKQMSELSEKDIDEIRHLRGHVENIASQVYFASGSFEEKQSKPGLDSSAKRLFIQEQAELIKAVIQTGDVKAAHEFVGMALAYQDVDPVWSLKLVEDSISASVGSGSAYESLMASSIAEFVKGFIAKHRQHLQDKANQRSLMKILDEFVDVGWPEAINLTQDLEEIFR